MFSLSCRPFVALFALLALPAMGAPAVSGAAHARHTPTGKVHGTIRAAANSNTNHLQFFLDGARARPQLQKGAFSLNGVPVGAHVLSITASGGSQGAHLSVTVNAGTVTNVGAVQLETGGQITGIVSQLDPSTGNLTPLAGVTVLAQTPLVVPPCVGAGAAPSTGSIICAGGAGGGTPTISGPIIDPVPPLRATTDQNGAYVFAAVPPGGYRVSVVVPGLEAGVEFVFVAAGETATADFQLRPTIPDGVGTVNGTVTGLDGAAIEGALVTISTPITFFPPMVSAESVEHARLKGQSAIAIPINLPRSIFSTLTDAQGHYSLNVPSGYLTLDASADGFQPVELSLTVTPEATQTVDLKLDAQTATGGSIQGDVTDASSGKPLAGAQVTVLIAVPLARNGQHIPPAPLPPLQTVTDANGHYQLDGVPAGNLPVSAELAGYRASTQNVQVTDGGTATLDFKLVRLPVVPGTPGKG